MTVVFEHSQAGRVLRRADVGNAVAKTLGKYVDIDKDWSGEWGNIGVGVALPHPISKASLAQKV